jgi:transcriptional regulator with XRE-family HTH domain
MIQILLSWALIMKRKLLIPVSSGLKKLGSDLKKARLKRGLKMSVVADRAGISRETLSKIQKGDSGVGIGNYASVIFAIGLGVDWTNLADIEKDTMGQMLDEKRIPLRARDIKL